MRITSKILLASAASIALVGCADNSGDTSEADAAAAAEAAAAAAVPATIVGKAQQNEKFTTLVTALTVADLGETLAGEGPYTVFGPTNDAFDKVDHATLSELLTPEKKDDLTALLSYHVVAGKMTAADLTKAITEGEGMTTLETLQGKPLKATLAGNKVILEDVTGRKSAMSMTDVEATNGIIHAIDTVVMPS